MSQLIGRVWYGGTEAEAATTQPQVKVAITAADSNRTVECTECVAAVMGSGCKPGESDVGTNVDAQRTGNK